MSFNKKVHLGANIEAIRTVLALEREQRAATDDERKIMQGYSGFGGLKCVLNPASSLTDTSAWAKSELELFPLVAELHRVIRDNTSSEKEYKQYFNSIKNSVLTAFYTPPEAVQAIADAIKDSGIEINRFLDPSAGMGEFSRAFGNNGERISFEKDILTGKLLSHLQPDDKVKIEGFETIEGRYNNYFDVVSSNIPFGEMSVFDATFMKQDALHRDSTKAIHNYFFVKGVESLREGGIMAFVTSQGVMNSPNNEPVRKWLMENTNLISAIRLPNNLFTDYAGTEVGSDLIVLQKNTAKEKMNFGEELFVKSSPLPISGIYNNDYFYNHTRIVQNKGFIGTDPYGKPAQVFLYEGSRKEMADYMGQMLKSDLKFNLDTELYNKHRISNTQKQTERLQPQTVASQDIKPTLKSEDTFYYSELNPLHQAEELDPFWQAVEDDWFPENRKKWSEGRETAIKKKPASDLRNQSVMQEPETSLYDLFGFSQEERTQVKSRRGKRNKAPLNLPKGETSKTLISTIGQTLSGSESLPLGEVGGASRSYSGELFEFHKKGSLVEDKGQVGFLKERYRDDAEFQALDVAFDQRSKISRYIEIRDTYHALYNHEAKHLTEHASLRGNLNICYDNFVRRYGNLNDKKNLDVIKMDAGGIEILSLERKPPLTPPQGENQSPPWGVGGLKADIFHHPVAFNPNEISVANTSDEALIASLNKYGEVRPEYMQSLMGDKDRDEIISELQGRIYFNPLVQNYEVRDKFIAGNVIEKSEAIERYLQNHPDDIPSQASLKALQEATPQPIRYEELDFNFGERWIGTPVYEDYMSKLFETDVDISYYASRDDFTVKADRSNMIINEKFAVQGESKLYTGIHLLKHALLNTTPNITKTIKVTDPDTGEDKNVKVPDGQAIQMANTKIDEIRNGFTDWLDQQSPEFKNKLADSYNRKFNCFVRPQYDGSHQNFPGLDLRSLGIPDLYQSQKDCVWMLKQNGGGICDHEVGAGKTLIMCTAAYEMKRLGQANKPMIIGLKANVHEIASTFRTAYPNARILYPGKEDFTPQKRVKIFNENRVGGK
ncbi:N-6 DNA methylase [Dysgonomonas sp. 521]|uniref:N-6 DNA methylase n=1 Tax=Dysgonomonas sp. 521 TaxID=2302932 RepID=UPI0021056DDA|nr:N-6 DNA methylase [Dysgonomonas sp. 521]